MKPLCTIPSNVTRPVSVSHMQEALGYNYVHVLWHVILPADWFNSRLHASFKEVKRTAARHRAFAVN